MVAYSFQRRFVAPICAGLGREIPRGFFETIQTDHKPKRQTIRAVGKKRHVKPGGLVQLYYGLRTKDCFQIGTGICTNVRPIRIHIEVQRIIVDYKRRYPLILETIGDLHDFAQRDGFLHWNDMREFWRETHDRRLGTFDGLLIEWEPIAEPAHHDAQVMNDGPRTSPAEA